MSEMEAGAQGSAGDATAGAPDARTRTTRWDDPTPGLRAAQGMSGIAYLRAIQRGELPRAPIAALMGFDLTEVDEGRVVFTFEPGEYLYNPIGMVHGGAAATILDSAMGCAVQTLTATGGGYTTLELKVNYVRPLVVGLGEMRCEGHVINIGRRVALAEGRITGPDGKLYAHATTTCLIFQPGA
jgi:uncharacterized protein (TIGR00369 family)